MKQIKFSHVYEKMLNNQECEPPEKVFLIAVFKCKSEELPPRFVEYDTRYYPEYVDDEGNWTPDYNKTEYYKLPKGDVLVLLLKYDNYRVVDDFPIFFTTIRRATPEKEKYYRECAQRHEEFEVVIGK